MKMQPCITHGRLQPLSKPIDSPWIIIVLLLAFFAWLRLFVSSTTDDAASACGLGANVPSGRGREMSHSLQRCGEHEPRFRFPS